MTRLLTTTALGLLLGLTPALAQTETPTDETKTPQAAQEPAQPSEMAPVDPGEPAQPIPDGSAELPSLPDGSADNPESAAEMSPEADPSGDRAMPDSSVSEAPQSIVPKDDAGARETASVDSPQFLSKQAADDLLASDLIGQPVMNTSDEAVGDINDLVTDRNGKVVAVLIGAGGFLGLGEKDVAIRFEDLKLTRDENQDVKVIANLTSEVLNSAPDYETLDEQELTVGSAGKDIGEDESAY